MKAITEHTEALINQQYWLNLNIIWGNQELYCSKPVFEKLYEDHAFISGIDSTLVICTWDTWKKMFSKPGEFVDRYRLCYKEEKKAIYCPRPLLTMARMQPGKVVISFHSLRSANQSLLIDPAKFHHFADSFILITQLSRINQRDNIIAQLIKRNAA